MKGVVPIASLLRPLVLIDGSTHSLIASTARSAAVAAAAAAAFHFIIFHLS